MKVLVTGVTGQLGYDVAKELERRHIEYKGVGSKDMDLTVPSEVEKVVTTYHPDAVIHCAAYTAVDKAEDEYGRAMDVNAKGTLALAKAAKEIRLSAASQNSYFRRMLGFAFSNLFINP